MGKCEYIEGPRAQENFEEGMKALFRVPKDEVVKAERKAKRKRAARDLSQRKPKISDKD
jgi:hypothetical protein